MNIHDVIVKPIITERSMDQVTKGKFTFEVAKKADKKTIRAAIEDQFNVKVVSVSTAIMKGKKKRFGVRRTEVKASDRKKAIVKLAVGQKIDMFDVGRKQ